MSEIAAGGVRLGIPIVGEFQGSRLVAGDGEEHVSVAAFFVRASADLAQAEHLEEGDAVLQRTDADHGVQIFGHGVSSDQRVRGGAGKGRGMVIKMVRVATRLSKSTDTTMRNVRSLKIKGDSAEAPPWGNSGRPRSACTTFVVICRAYDRCPARPRDRLAFRTPSSALNPARIAAARRSRVSRDAGRKWRSPVQSRCRAALMPYSAFACLAGWGLRYPGRWSLKR